MSSRKLLVLWMKEHVEQSYLLLIWRWWQCRQCQTAESCPAQTHCTQDRQRDLASSCTGHQAPYSGTAQVQRQFFQGGQEDLHWESAAGRESYVSHQSGIPHNCCTSFLVHELAATTAAAWHTYTLAHIQYIYVNKQVNTYTQTHHSEKVRVARNWHGKTSETTLAKYLTDGICQFIRCFDLWFFICMYVFHLYFIHCYYHLSHAVIFPTKPSVFKGARFCNLSL